MEFQEPLPWLHSPQTRRNFRHPDDPFDVAEHGNSMTTLLLSRWLKQRDRNTQVWIKYLHYTMIYINIFFAKMLSINNYSVNIHFTLIIHTWSNRSNFQKKLIYLRVFFCFVFLFFTKDFLWFIYILINSLNVISLYIVYNINICLLFRIICYIVNCVHWLFPASKHKAWG